MPDSTRITVKLTPKASRSAVQGWADGANGERWLKCQVTEAPDKGKANKALMELLAEYLNMPKSSFTIIRGETDRLKIIEIQGLKEGDLTHRDF